MGGWEVEVAEEVSEKVRELEVTILLLLSLGCDSGFTEVSSSEEVVPMEEIDEVEWKVDADELRSESSGREVVAETISSDGITVDGFI